MKDKPNEKNAAVVQPKKPDSGFSAYIGPNLPGIIQTGTIYPVGKKQALEREDVKLALDKKPGIAELIVEGDELAEARIKVKIPGEALCKKYQALRRA